MFWAALRRRLQAARTRRQRQLLRVLGEDDAAFRSIDELAAETDLGPYLYPTLAELDRRGLIERRWLEGTGGALLGYRLSVNTPEATREGELGSRNPTKV